MGFLLLVAQILFFLVLFLFSNLIALFTLPYLLLMFITGLVVTGLGYLTIGLASYSPLPKPRKKNVLIRRGIYRFVRHPIYAGLMLIGFSFLLSRLIAISAVAYLLFLLATEAKANLEEKLISEKYPEYKDYKQSVGKYLPLVFEVG